MTTRILVATARTTGTRCGVHSLVDLGAVWLTGGGGAESFGGECAAFEGAEFSDRVTELTGITRELATDPYLPPESQAVRDFVRWAGAMDAPVILAGLRPSMVRAFLLAAARRSRSKLEAGELPRFPARYLDAHSLFVRHCMATGVPVPSRGFHPGEMFDHFNLPPSTFAMPAVEAAVREHELMSQLMSP